MLRSVPSPQPQGFAISSFAIPSKLDPTPDPNPLLSFAGPIAGSHTLVIAPNGLDLLCDLLRQGCLAATTVSPFGRSEQETYDLVLAPRVVSATQIGRLIYQAKRALIPTGRFLAYVPTEPAELDQDVAGLLVRSIKSSGFVAVRTKTLLDGLLVRADLPLRGMPIAMSMPLRRQA